MRLQRLNPGFIVMTGPTQSLGKGLHDGKTLLLNSPTGVAITLPPALGSGCRLRFVTTVASTSGTTVIRIRGATDLMAGNAALSLASGAGLVFPSVANSNTLTLNRTTTGGASNGETIEMEDALLGLWIVEANLNASGALATPFSNT